MSAFFLRRVRDGWVLSAGPELPPVARFLTFKEAVAAARRRATEGEAVQVAVLDETGRWLTKFTFHDTGDSVALSPA
jgi:hypothetical protein